MVTDALQQELGRQPLFRIGGDEFAALRQTDDETACLEKLQRITEQIRADKFSISYGIVTFSGEVGLDCIVREADARMLKAKSVFLCSPQPQAKLSCVCG